MAKKMSPRAGKILGFAWSNVSGGVVTYDPPNKVIGYLTGPREAGAASLKGELAGDDMAIVHVGLMQKVAKARQDSIKLDKYEENKGAYLEILETGGWLKKGMFVEVGLDMPPVEFAVWLALPGFNKVFGSEDMADEARLDKIIQRYIVKIRSK
jgi:hypothetical protein